MSTSKLSQDFKKFTFAGMKKNIAVSNNPEEKKKL